MLCVLPFLLVVFLLALSRAAVLPTENEAVAPAADSESMENVSIPESRDKEVMPESADDADMAAQDWVYARPFSPFSPYIYNSWHPFYDRRILFPYYHDNFFRMYDEADNNEEAPKLSKRDAIYGLTAGYRRNSVVEAAIIDAQNDEGKLCGLVQTYPLYFRRFYRPVYNRFSYYYPRLFRANPAFFRIHYPVLYRVYASDGWGTTLPVSRFASGGWGTTLPVSRFASGGWGTTLPASRFVLANEEDEEPQSEDIPESGRVEAENQLNKRDEGFEAEDVQVFCVRVLAGQRPVSAYTLARCRDVLGLPRFDEDTDYTNLPDLGGSIRAEVYRRLNRAFSDAMIQSEE